MNSKLERVRLSLDSLEDRVVFDANSSLLGSDASSVSPLINPDVFTGGVLVTAGDVTGDGYADIVTGAGPGGGPHVRVFDGKSGQIAWEFMAYDPNFRGGVSVAVGDVNGDGRLDIVTGAGPGGAPHIKVFDSVTRSESLSFYSFDAIFLGGVRVAVGDTDGDGKSEIAVTSGNGGTAEVRLFSGLTGRLLTSIQTETSEDRNGATVALADFTQDGKADLVVGSGGGVTQVQVFDLNSGNQQILSIAPYDPGFVGTVWVAAGDITGDGIADIITGAGRGGGPHVRVFDGKSQADAGSWMAYNPEFRGGVFVAAADLNADGKLDVVTGAGPGGGPHVRIFDANNQSDLGSFFAYVPVTTNGGFSTQASISPPTPGLNTPPKISDLSNQTTAVNSVVGPLAFTVVDAETLADQLIVSASSSNTELIPNANIFLGGTGATRNILLTPATDKSGTSIITLTVTDSNGSSTSDQFTVTVNLAVVPPPPGTVDTTPPRVTITTKSGQLLNLSPAITGEVSDDFAGVALLQVSINNGGFADVPFLANGTFSFTPTTSIDGVHLVNFRALDKAGNFSALTSFAFTLDATAPTADLGFTSILRTNPTTFDVTFSEDVSASAFDVASYRLSRSNAPLSLASVERLDARRVRIHLASPLTDDANYRFEVIGTIRDAAGNALTGVLSASFEVAKPAAIESLSPANGEEQVSLTRETIVRFDETIDPATITPESFYLIANGERIAGRIRVSPTEKFATFFYESPLPASTEVRAILDGNLVRGRDGRLVDGNGDGTPGGTATADFRTLPITNIPGTRLFAYIYDSFNRDAAGNNIPVVGATVSLDANPNIKAVTDAAGRFELGIPNAAAGVPDGLPAPVFFVHIDGSTAVNAPTGTRYATLGKPFHTVPGQQVQLNMAGTPFNIYLPPMAMGDIVPLNPTADTEVGFGAAGQAQIRRIMAERFPNDPVKAAAQADLAIAAMRVTYPAGSALSESGVAATQATIIPVDPSRLPAPLPPGSNPGLVISIQAGTSAGFNLAGGSTNFDIPAPVSFPNLDGLAPGEKMTIMSFDHDKGGYFPIGTATVSADGKSVVSDPGVGILAPGWHFLERLAFALGLPPIFSDPPVINSCEDAAKALEENYQRRKGTGDAVLAHQAACLAREICATPEWKGTWIEDTIINVARGLGDTSRPTDYNPDIIGTNILCRNLPSWVTVPGVIGINDLCAIPAGARHFVYELAPDFWKHRADLESDFDGDGEADHNRFLRDIVSKCFDEVYDAGELNPLPFAIAQATVPVTAAGLRQQISDLYGLFSGSGNLRTSIRSNDKFWFSDKLDQVGNLKIGSATGVFRVGSPTKLIVNKSSVGGSFVDVSNDANLQIYPFGADGEISTSADGSITVNYSASPSTMISNWTYVFVRQGENYGFGQIEIVDADQDGDLLCDSYETRQGLSINENNQRSDQDNDGISDFSEILLATNPLSVDTDYDGRLDGTELSVGKSPRYDETSPTNSKIYYAVMTGTNEVISRGTSTTLNGIVKTGLPRNTSLKLVAVNELELRSFQRSSNPGVAVGTVNSIEFISPNNGCIELSGLTRQYVSSGDSDSDGVHDFAELIIGTSSARADTDGDGISDFAEIQQGLDPLGGRGFPTGVIADLALRGESQAIDIQGSTTNATQQTAYVATGSYGLALVDASQFQNPIILGQLDLAGIAVDVAVDSPTKIAVVAAGEGGLHFVDVSDPMLPKRLRTASVNALQVEVIDGIAFVTTPDRVLAYDVASGDQIGFGVVLNSPARGMTHEGNALFVMSADRTVQAFTVNGFAITARGSIQLTHGGGQISVSNGVLYAAAIASTAQGGFATADIRNLDSLSEISPSDVSGGFAYPGQVIVPNGSGLGLLGGLALTGQRFAGVQIVNTSDPANTNQVVTQFATSAAPTSISIASGIGFVASATGLQIVNYVPFDTKGVAPTITITGPTSATIDEGSLVSFGANVTDDVQVRNVELLVNGQVVRNAVSAPFDLSAVMPSLATGVTMVRIQARATDTGGNSKLSNELIFTLTPDSTPPTLLGSNPTNDGAGFQMKGLTLFFSEPIDASKLAVGGVQLTNLGKNAQLGGGDDTTVSIASITALSDRRISVQFDAPLAAGRYQVRFDPTILADRAGNAIAQPIDFPFTSYVLDALNANAWIGENGNWNDAQNWSAGRVPSENDAVIIDRLNTNIRVRLSTGNVKVKSIISNEELVLDGGNLTVTEASIFNGRFEVSKGSTFTASGSQAVVIANGETKIDGGSLIAQNGGIIRLPNVTSYTNTRGSYTTATLRAEGVGSVLDLRNVTSLSSDPTLESLATNVQSLSGGLVDLRSATQITEPAGRNRAYVLLSDGIGSRINLASLASFTDTGFFNSTITARNGGVIDAPRLVALDGVSVTLDNLTGLPITQIQNWSNSTADLGGATYLFPALTSAVGTTFHGRAGAVIGLPVLTTLRNGGLTLEGGATVTVPVLANIDGANILVLGGVTLALPNVTSYTNTRGSYTTATLRAEGVGSVLDLRNVTSLSSDPTLESLATNVQSLSGGLVDLRSATQITEPAGRNRAYVLLSDGIGSRINLASLASFTDTGFFNSTITARNGGTLFVLPLPGSTFVTGVFVLTETNGTIEGDVTLGANSSRIDR